MNRKTPQVIRVIKTAFFMLIVQLIAVNAIAQIEPYLSSPTSTSIWVSWRTTAETESKVEFGTSPDNLSNVATGTNTSLADNYQWHTVKLTGLTADTRYYYRVVSEGQTSKIQRFRSQPPEGTKTGHYRFAIIGDHQIISDDRYQRLVQACKDKVIEKYATSASDTLIEDHLRLLVCDGDQVTIGTLEHYEKMHFGQSRPLMSNIPIMTVVGNHEYNNDPNLVNYFGHYVYDDISYKSIIGNHGEEYYAFQVANILFVMINSVRGTDPDQYSWIEQIVSAADNDSSVEWVFAINHYCLFSEQMPGDGFAAVRDGYSPRLAQTDKLAMHVTGHSHLYSRGSLRDHPCHVIINGGASGDQFWGETAYMDYQDVQKTIERQIFQIVDIDLDKREMHVETYSNGTSLPPGFTENKMIDEYYLKLDAPAPEKPSVSNSVPEIVALPFVFSGSEYSGQEPMNSVEYQVAAEDTDFINPEYAYKTDFENLFLSTGSPNYTPIDQNAGVDITQMALDSSQIFSGSKFFRFRYRDQSLHWSPWSDTISFIISNGRTVPPNYPVLRYKLDGNAGECMGSGLNGMPNSSTSFISDEEIGKVANFNNNSMITISSGNTEELNLPAKTLSVSCWVKLNSTDFWGGFVGIFQDNGNYEKGWVLGTYDGSFSFALSTGDKLNYLKANTSINFGEWYQIVGTYDGATQKIYVNGELKGIASLEGEISYPPDGWFQIGAYKDDNEAFGHDGNISDVIIWEGAIPPKDVKNLYHKTIPPYANFDAGKTGVSVGKFVEFDDMSQFEPKSWQWHFEGGTPETSNEKNPEVYYEKSGVFDVSLVVTNEFGSDSVRKEKYITVGTTGNGTFELNSNSIEIFPNPASGELEIRTMAEPISGYKIYNTVGKLYKISELQMSAKVTVDISSLPEGFYFVQISQNGYSFVKKFVKVDN